MSKEYNSNHMTPFFDEKPKSPAKDLDVLDLSYSKMPNDLDSRVDMFDYNSAPQPFERISYSGFNDSFGVSALNGLSGLPVPNSSTAMSSQHATTRLLPLGNMGVNLLSSYSIGPVKQDWDDDDTLTHLPRTRSHLGPQMNGSQSSRRERARPKSAHNVIEQRYRNKINDKFTALQNSVPTLRVIARKKSKSRSDDDEDDDEYYYLPPLEREEDLEGLEPARKLNKGTILAKSVEYIKFLERKNDRMKVELQQLVERAQMLGIVMDESTLDAATTSNFDR